MIRRPPRSTQSRSSAASDVYKRQLYERPMSLDEQFALVLPRSGDTPAIVLCAVACWQPLAKDVYGIGARYVRILRDGGDPALPIEINPNSQSFAPVLQAVRAKAS